MHNFGVNVAMLNRFCTPKEQKQTLQALEEGRIDVLIGTHRLLQPENREKIHKLYIIIEL